METFFGNLAKNGLKIDSKKLGITTNFISKKNLKNDYGNYFTYSFWGHHNFCYKSLFCSEIVAIIG